MKKFLLGLGLIAAVLNSACTRRSAPPGSAEAPIRLFLVPSVDAKVLESEGEKIVKYLEENTPYKYKLAIPASYIAVVEAFGTNRADVAALNTFGYILANEKYGVEARITLVRFGLDTYQSQIVVRSDSGIEKVEDLKGKKFAYVDPASASGYLMPAKFFKDKGIGVGETVFAQKHDNVIMMVYQKQVEAGATFYSPPQDGKVEDARRLVVKQYPDVVEKVKILTLTDPLPNDPIVFRKELPEEVKTAIANALFSYIKTEEGRAAFKSIYGANDFKPATDASYAGVREMLKALGKSASDLTGKK